MTEEALSVWSMVTNPYVVAVVIGANSLAIAISVLFSAGAYPQPISRSLHLFGAGKLLTAIGFALIALRAELHPTLTVVCGNTLALGGFSINLLALQTLQNRPIRPGFPLLMAAATIAGGVWFTFVDLDLRGLRLTTSVVTLLICGALAVELLIRYRGVGRAHLLGGALAVLLAVVMAARIFNVIGGDRQAVSLLSGDLTEKFVFMIAYVGATMSALNFALISNDAFNGELRRLAASDPLTGLPNRRRLLESGAEETRRARRYHRPLALLVLDVDHFKNINDEHGHAMGDAVLRALAQSCRATLRDIDMFARLGGEEFVALLPETPLDEATAAAERLRAAIAVLQIDDAPDLRLTASLGVALLREDEDFEAALAHADQAMYQAKRAGRNRVCVAEN